MDLNKTTIRYYEMVCDGHIAKEESADIIVPDMYPDIARLVDTAGITVLKEKNLRSDGVELGGLVKVQVLYMPEGEKGIKKVELSLPFSHLFEHAGLSDTAHVVAEARLLTCDSRTVNPRKVNVAVGVQLGVRAYEPTDWPLSCDVMEAQDAGVELWKTEQNVYLTTAVADRYFNVTEDIEVPPSRPPVSDVLKVDVVLTPQDIRPIGNKLILKGIATLHMLYHTGKPEMADCMARLDQDIPFSHVLEMEGMDEDGVVDVHLQLCGLDIEPRSGMSGEARALGVTLQICAQAVASEEKTVSVLSDLYSISYDVTPVSKMIPVKRLVDKNVRRQNIRESFETGQSLASVMDARVMLWPVQQTTDDGKTELSADAQITVLYLGDDEQFYSMSRRMTIALPMDVPWGGGMEVYARLAGDVTASPAHDGMEVRFGVDFDVTMTRADEFSMVWAVNADLSEMKDRSGVPSAVLRRSHAGESLWQIAKMHNTTMKNIAEANGLEMEEALPVGKMLLIPYQR